MNYTEHKFTLDVSKTASQVSIKAKKGDIGRRLVITLMNNGYPYHITEDCYAVIAATKPDGYIIFNNCVIDNCVITYDFTAQTVAAAGIVNCEIILYGKRAMQLTSASFDIIVEDSNFSSVESSSEANAFAALLLEVKALNALGLKAPAIVTDAEGELINITDGSNEVMQGLRIFGKSTQEGAPTLNNPVEIVSVGTSGEINCSVTGRNMLDASAMTAPDEGTAVEITDDGYGIKFYAKGEAKSYAKAVVAMDHLAGRKFYVSYDNRSNNQTGEPGYLQIRYYLAGVLQYIENTVLLSKENEIPAGAYDITLVIYFKNSSGTTAAGTYVQYDGLRVSQVAGSVWEPYKEIQKFTAYPEDVLRGIPVASGGNYTDADGQEWICDEIDLARKVVVQRIGTITSKRMSQGAIKLNTAGTKYNQYTITFSDLNSAGNASTTAGYMALCNYLPLGNQVSTVTSEACFWIYGKFTVALVLNNTDFPNVEGVAAWLANNDLEIQYILAEPVETKLTAEEIAAFAELQSYKLNTLIYNDAGAYMIAEYVADTKTYVDRYGGSGGSSGAGGSSVTIGVATLLAEKWEGDADPYKQVVTIEGVTKRSMVTLNPSVEQLAIFHDKDLAFVTENDNGIVTVYAIGDKPENDYTVQVSITEVNV